MTTRYPAYRRRVTGLHRRFHTVRLQPDANFDIRNHVSSVRLPARANGKQALEDAMAAFVAKEWDLSRPLWEAQVIYGYEDGTGAKSALIARAHHSESPRGGRGCMAAHMTPALSDGQGFVLSQLSTTSARAMIEKKLAKAAAKEKNLERGSAKISDLPFAGLSTKLQPLDPYVPSLVVSLVFWLLWLIFSAISMLYGLWAGLHAGVMYLTFRPHALRYTGTRPTAKEFSFSDAVAVDDVKVVQKAFKSPTRHITLNDVMCAVVSKSIRSYCDSVEDMPDRR
jgi:hypothetical protein